MSAGPVLSTQTRGLSSRTYGNVGTPGGGSRRPPRMISEPAAGQYAYLFRVQARRSRTAVPALVHANRLAFIGSPASAYVPSPLHHALLPLEIRCRWVLNMSSHPSPPQARH